MKAATDVVTIGSFKFFISIHAAREGGDDHGPHDFFYFCPISIHAAREGGDKYDIRYSTSVRISIHAAREGGDHERKL